MPQKVPSSRVDCYLSSEAYFLCSDNVKVLFKGMDDPCFNIQWSPYQRTYMLLLHLFKELRQYNVKNFNIYNDSRIVEEMKLQIEQLTQWGRGVFVYIEQNCLPYFVDYSFYKISTEELLDKIRKGDKMLDEQRIKTVSINYGSLSQRRLNRFKNEATNSKRRKRD